MNDTHIAALFLILCGATGMLALYLAGAADTKQLSTTARVFTDIATAFYGVIAVVQLAAALTIVGSRIMEKLT